MNTLTAEQARDLLHYDPDAGMFTTPVHLRHLRPRTKPIYYPNSSLWEPSLASLKVSVLGLL